jgi:hypothetical protein
MYSDVATATRTASGPDRPTAWQDFHRRLAVGDEKMFIGEIVKRLIGHEQIHLRALLDAAGLAYSFDGSLDQGSADSMDERDQPAPQERKPAFE